MEILRVGKHTFKASRPGTRGPSVTFSVGCCECVPAAGGGLKLGKAKVRVRGPVSRHGLVFYTAIATCKQLDAGTYAGPKTLTV